MAAAEVSPPVADHAEDQLSRDLADLRVRAKHAAAQLADIHARLAVLEEQIRLHQHANRPLSARPELPGCRRLLT